MKGHVGLGQCRLSIIDLSPLGHQPMSNEDGTVWITFNGEIYNYLELRDELIKKGHHFRSQTDTEAIVHLTGKLRPARTDEPAFVLRYVQPGLVAAKQVEGS